MKNRRGSVETPGLDVLGPLQELLRQLRDGTLTAEQVQAFVEHRNPFGDVVDTLAMLHDWERFYLDVFGLEKDFSGLVVPPRQAGFGRLIVVAEGMTPNRLFEACQKHFSLWWYAEDLDTVKSERTADRDYAVWVRDRREADDELRSLSADDLGKQSIAGITLEERLIYELKFFRETGEHLDVANWTLCSGSRGPGGVPGVDWSRVCGRMDVDWCSPGCRDECLRARAVVSA